MHLSKQIESMYDDAVRIRQDLHRIPEIGFQLRDTQAYVLARTASRRRPSAV